MIFLTQLDGSYIERNETYFVVVGIFLFPLFNTFLVLPPLWREAKTANNTNNTVNKTMFRICTWNINFCFIWSDIDMKNDESGNGSHTLGLYPLMEWPVGHCVNYPFFFGCCCCCCWCSCFHRNLAYFYSCTFAAKTIHAKCHWPL